MNQPKDFSKRQWEFLIVGTGMGGSTLGYALAKAGREVLFCEMGRSQLGNPRALKGDFPEGFKAGRGRRGRDAADILADAGRFALAIEDATTSRPRRFIPFLGSGTGGSSALYGMAMERFHPADFEPRGNHPDADGCTLPEKWPVSYDELRPYYDAAEKLYRVRGIPELEPPALSAAGRELFEFFSMNGLHPHRLAVACDYAANCRCCQSYLCADSCKNDASRICLAPALKAYGAELLVQCRAKRLEASCRRVEGVVCSYLGKELLLRAKTVILAAGALETPRILLDSASPQWPGGLANESGCVGENLMRHYIDLYAVDPKQAHRSNRTHKELAIDDFYCSSDGKFGTLQTFGPLPPVQVLLAALEEGWRQRPFPGMPESKRPAEAMLRSYLEQFDRSYVLASVLEDLPYRENKVSVSRSGGIQITYRIRESERARIRRFREILRGIFHSYHFTLLPQAEKNQNLAHACGTCRFGDDPATSVLDKWNRAHGVTNLYVVDGSFFPSSGGTGPALTIAANALRVADHFSAS